MYMYGLGLWSLVSIVSTAAKLNKFEARLTGGYIRMSMSHYHYDGGQME